MQTYSGQHIMINPINLRTSTDNNYTGLNSWRKLEEWINITWRKIWCQEGMRSEIRWRSWGCYETSRSSKWSYQDWKQWSRCPWLLQFPMNFVKCPRQLLELREGSDWCEKRKLTMGLRRRKEKQTWRVFFMYMKEKQEREGMGSVTAWRSKSGIWRL